MARRVTKTDQKYAVMSAKTTQEWFEWFMCWKTPSLMKQHKESIVQDLVLFDAYPDVFDSIDLSFWKAYSIRFEQETDRLALKLENQKFEISSLQIITTHPCVIALIDYAKERSSIDRVNHELNKVTNSLKHRRLERTARRCKQTDQVTCTHKSKPVGYRLLGRIPDDIIKRANGTFNKYKNGEIHPRITKKNNYLVLNVGRDWRMLNRGTGFELMSHERYNNLILL
ncbi:ParE family toxin-like protein [Vibrio harveyi]|uniref:ParE family toxin-like protein n=1 Tax=Vibrio harveyi TaxID=669 RepID=UPI00039FC297|nr:hypothetical protein [Vibrio harveyi]MBY7699336.1 hypothetical protein [Vibrio harveyi]UIL56471.1 hypothetical protein LXG94_02225 [Vibrio harveyi]SQA36249.1 Uncharacterised protein [Vibrio harveyi]